MQEINHPIFEGNPDQKKQKVIIFGASGFVGGEIVRILAESKRFELFTVSSQKNRQETAYSFCIDVTKPKDLNQLKSLGKVDIAINAAGLAHQFGVIDSEKFHQVNVAGVKNICKISKELSARKHILLSSVAVYGNHGAVSVNESFLCTPKGVYAESKYFGEKEFLKILPEKSCSNVILRPVTVIGENDPGNMMRLIRTINKGRFVWVGNGRNKKSFIYKTDIARAVVRLIEEKFDGTHIFNLSGGEISVKEVVETICTALGKRLPRVKIPDRGLSRIFEINRKYVGNRTISNVGDQLQKWLADDVYSAEKIAEQFGIKAQTTIREGLQRQVRAFLKEGC